MTRGRNDPGPKQLTYLGRNDPPQKLAETTQAETTQGQNDPDSLIIACKLVGGCALTA